MSRVDELANKMEEVLSTVKSFEFMPKKEEKKASPVVIVFAVIGVVVAVAAALYGIYRFFTPDYLDDFEDDFEDDFDDDFFEKRKRVLQKNSPNHRGRLKEGAVARSSRALLFFSV